MRALRRHRGCPDNRVDFGHRPKSTFIRSRCRRARFVLRNGRVVHSCQHVLPLTSASKAKVFGPISRTLLSKPAKSLLSTGASCPLHNSNPPDSGLFSLLVSSSEAFSIWSNPGRSYHLHSQVAHFRQGGCRDFMSRRRCPPAALGTKQSQFCCPTLLFWLGWTWSWNPK